MHDRLNDNSLSVTLCAKMGKNTIKIQSYYIKNITEKNPLYIFIPKESKKYEVGHWEYDISSFKIYKLTHYYIIENNLLSYIEDNTVLNNSLLVSLNLDELILVYNSDTGLITVPQDQPQEFSLREKACLYLKLPESGTKWLDDLIIKKNKQDLI